MRVEVVEAKIDAVENRLEAKIDSVKYELKAAIESSQGIILKWMMATLFTTIGLILGVVKLFIH